MKKFLVEGASAGNADWGYNWLAAGTIEAESLDAAEKELVQRVDSNGKYGTDGVKNPEVSDADRYGYCYYRVVEMPEEFRSVPWCSCTKDDCPVFQHGAKPHECSVKGVQCWASPSSSEKKEDVHRLDSENWLSSMGYVQSFLRHGYDVVEKGCLERLLNELLNKKTQEIIEWFKDLQKEVYSYGYIIHKIENFRFVGTITITFSCHVYLPDVILEDINLNEPVVKVYEALQRAIDKLKKEREEPRYRCSECGTEMDEADGWMGICLRCSSESESE